MLDIRVGKTVTMDVIGKVIVKKVFKSNNRISFFGIKENDSNRGWVFKGFSLHDYEGEQLPEEEIEKLINRILSYQRQLKSLNVSVIDGIGFIQRYREDGTFFLWQYEPFVGKSCEIRIKNSKREVALLTVEAIWKQVVKPLFENGFIIEKPDRLKVGIDLIPRNITFIEDDNGEIETCSYVDLFPPKIRIPVSESKHQHVLEFPDPTDEIVRKLAIIRGFNMVGIIVAFLTHLSSIRPEMTLDFYELLSSLLDHIDHKSEGFSLKKKIEEYTLNHKLQVGCKSKEEIKILINPWGFEDIFLIRMLTWALVYYRLCDETLLIAGQIMKMSHFQDSPLSDETIHDIKEAILRITESPVIR